MGDFYQEEIAGLLKKAFDRIAAVERTLAIQQRIDELEPSEPAPETPASHPGLSTYFWYTTLVVTTDEANRCFLGKILVPTDSSSKWTLSSTWTYLQTVDVPEGLDLPQAGSVVGAFNTGPYAINKTRFALFGAGGGKIVRCKISSISYDHLIVRTVTSSGDVTGDLLNVAKPTKLQMTALDDQTVSYGDYSLLFNTLGVQQRSVTVVGGEDDGLVDVQEIIPKYLVGDFIFKMTASGGTGVFADGEEVTEVDVNIDARMWSRVA